MEKLLLTLLESGGLLGMLVVAMALGMGLWLRTFKFSVSPASSSRPSSVEQQIGAVGTKVDVIGTKMDGISRRLDRVEQDLENRPTREEVHDVETSVTRLEGRFAAVEAILKTTNAAVLRIEDYMLRASERSESRSRRRKLDDV